MRLLPVLLSVGFLVASCGKDGDGDGDGDDGPALDSQPTAALVVGENQKVEADLAAASGLGESFTHGYQKVFTFTLTAEREVSIDVASSMNACAAIDAEPAKMQGPYFTVRTAVGAAALVTSRVGQANVVPSFEFPGKLPAGDYIVEALWLATGANCSVTSEIRIEEDDVVVKKFPDIAMTLGAAQTFSKPLVEGGSDVLWSAFSLEQEFRLNLTAAAAVTFELAALVTDCPTDGATYNIYDYQAMKNLASGDLTAALSTSLGDLPPGLYAFNVMLGNDTACNLAFTAAFR